MLAGLNMSATVEEEVDLGAMLDDDGWVDEEDEEDVVDVVAAQSRHTTPSSTPRSFRQAQERGNMEEVEEDILEFQPQLGNSSNSPMGMPMEVASPTNSGSPHAHYSRPNFSSEGQFASFDGDVEDLELDFA
jgi:hypothetical protein